MLKGYHECGGRNTWEHAFIYAGRQIQERWAIICICAAGQDVDRFQDSHRMDKDLNKWVALNRATDEELRAYSRAIDYVRERRRLNDLFGPYVPWGKPVDKLCGEAVEKVGIQNTLFPEPQIAY